MFTSLFALLAIGVHCASAHYVFSDIIVGESLNSAAVRRVTDPHPLWAYGDSDLVTNKMRCNVVVANATATVDVHPGDKVGLSVSKTLSLEPYIYHPGPAALYISKAPGVVANYFGDGEWIKIAEWGPIYTPEFNFTSMLKSELTTTLPAIPDGEYLLRAEHVGIHDMGSPQFYVGCAQIKVTGGSGVLPTGVKIPGFVTGTEPSYVFDVLAKNITYYPMPAPTVWSP